MRSRPGSTRLCIALALALLLFPSVAGPLSGPAIAADAPGALDPSHMYAVNLSSSLEPVDPARLPRPDILGKYLVYATVYKTPANVWHRLRIGFFPTREAAASAMAPLLKEYPGAWVTKVSASERSAAPGQAILRPLPPVAPAPVVRPPAALPKATPATLMEEASRAMSAGEYMRAAGLYKEVLKAPGDEFDPEAQEKLGLAYELGGEPGQARAEYKAYLLLYPAGKGAARVRARLAALEPPEKAVRPVEKKAKEPVEEPVIKKRPAEEPPVKTLEKKARRTKEGFFVALGVTRVEIGGNFDGKWSLVGAASTDVLPNLETATGFKLGAGYRLDRGSIELNYAQSDHDGTWAGAEKPSTLKAYSVDAKLFVTRGVFGLRPFVALGAGYITLDIKDGSTNGVDTADTKLKGRDLRVGAGVEVPLYEHVALDLQGMYRWGSYRSVEGLESGDIDGHIDGNGATFSIEAKYVF